MWIARGYSDGRLRSGIHPPPPTEGSVRSDCISAGTSTGGTERPKELLCPTMPSTKSFRNCCTWAQNSCTLLVDIRELLGKAFAQVPGQVETPHTHGAEGGGAAVRHHSVHGGARRVGGTHRHGVCGLLQSVHPPRSQKTGLCFGKDIPSPSDATRGQGWRLLQSLHLLGL